VPVKMYNDHLTVFTSIVTLALVSRWSSF